MASFVMLASGSLQDGPGLPPPWHANIIPRPLKSQGSSPLGGDPRDSRAFLEAGIVALGICWRHVLGHPQVFEMRGVSGFQLWQRWLPRSRDQRGFHCRLRDTVHTRAANYMVGGRLTGADVLLNANRACQTTNTVAFRWNKLHRVLQPETL